MWKQNFIFFIKVYTNKQKQNHNNEKCDLYVVYSINNYQKSDFTNI